MQAHTAVVSGFFFFHFELLCHLLHISGLFYWPYGYNSILLIFLRIIITIICMFPTWKFSKFNLLWFKSNSNIGVTKSSGIVSTNIPSSHVHFLHNKKNISCVDSNKFHIYAIHQTHIKTIVVDDIFILDHLVKIQKYTCQ